MEETEEVSLWLFFDIYLFSDSFLIFSIALLYFITNNIYSTIPTKKYRFVESLVYWLW